MFTDGIKEIFLEAAEEYGWLDGLLGNREIEKAKVIAKKLLLLGRPVEEVAEVTELSAETVMELLCIPMK